MEIKIVKDSQFASNCPLVDTVLSWRQCKATMMRRRQPFLKLPSEGECALHHRFGREIRVTWSNLLHECSNTIPNLSLKCLFSLLLKTSSERNSATSLGSLLQCLAVRTVRKFSLRSNLNMLCCILKQLLHILSSVKRENNCFPISLW